MNLEKAKELGAKYLEDSKTLCVVSDGSVFVDNDIDAMKEHAKISGKEIFVLKGEAKKEVKEIVAKTEAPKKSSKKHK